MGKKMSMNVSTFKTHMSRQNARHMRGGRPRTAPSQTWTRWGEDKTGAQVFVDPEPGRTYVKGTYPPVGRGRGESLTSPRRMAAKARAIEVIRLRKEGLTWEVIARMLGFRDPSGPYRAMKRMIDRMDWDARQRQKRKREREMYA